MATREIGAMATEDLGHGMTSDDVMRRRTDWLFQGGPVPPGLEAQADALAKERKRSAPPSALARFIHWLKN